MDNKLKIGFIGTGVMGKSLVKHLLKAGHEVNIYIMGIFLTFWASQISNAPWRICAKILNEASFINCMLAEM